MTAWRDVSQFIANTGRMMGLIQRVNVDMAAGKDAAMPATA
jgi:hypothetical protein